MIEELVATLPQSATPWGQFWLIFTLIGEYKLVQCMMRIRKGR